jgi:ferric-dicitrate binding protein FerR (iron transport regulator)
MDQKRHSEHPDTIIEDLIAKYLSGNISTEERQGLLTWVDGSEENRSYFDEMIQLWAATEDYDNEFEADIEQAWQKVAGKVAEKAPFRIEPKTSKKKGFFLNNKMLLRVAAAALLLVIATYWWSNSNQMVVMQTAFNESIEIELPDGSTVSLNQNSQISYPKSFKKRNIKLSGEAFFDVARDEERPFIITSGETETRVLGTSFNVRAYPEDDKVTVTVSSGRVEFNAEDNPAQKVVLQVNEEGVFTKNQKEVAKVEVINKNAISWKTQKLSFSDTPMKNVFDDLEKHFDIKIEVKNELIWQCAFFGTFDQPKLDDVIEAMKFSMGLAFEKDGNHYTVSGGSECGK